MLAEKIENALNESRILVLVAQVLLGFQYQTIFQAGFEKLPPASQSLKIVALGLMLLTLCLLMSPAAYHRIVVQGHLSQHLLSFITRVMALALFPFALAMGIDFYVVVDRFFNHSVGLCFGFLVFLLALFFWYGIEAFCANSKAQKQEDKTVMAETPTPLKERIKFVLTEARVVLPGAQALLGFQFAAVFTESFERLPRQLLSVHLASLTSVAVCTILLMAPAAFHRIAEHGEDTERLHAFSSRMILGAMAFLALGIAGDVFVVVQKVVHSVYWAGLSSSVTLLIFWGWWFGYMLYRRAENQIAIRQAVPTS